MSKVALLLIVYGNDIHTLKIPKEVSLVLHARDLRIQLRSDG